MAVTAALIEDKVETLRQMEALLAQRSDLRVVASCRSAEQALETLPGLRPDVAVVDILLPGASGIECVGALRPQLQNTHFLMLTVVEDYEDVFQAILAGATGYLIKTDGLDRLADAVVELHAGGSPMTPSIARRVIGAFQESARLEAAEAALTDRERQILTALSRGRLYKEVAHELGLSTATVRTHIQRIYKKLQVHNRKDATRHFRLPLGWLRRAR